MPEPYYDDGICQIYHGDCREILPTLTGIDAVITDFPYGVGLQAKVTKHRTRRTTRLYEDTPEYVQDLIREVSGWWLAEKKRVAMFPGTRMLFVYPPPTAMGCVFTPNGAGIDRWGFGCFHPILYYGKCPYMAKGLGSRPNSFSSSHPGMHVTGEDWIDHPCPKPLEWMLWLVNRASLPEETIVDPCMGSGTTLRAAKDLGRKAIGIEREEGDCEIAAHRLRQEVLPLAWK